MLSRGKHWRSPPPRRTWEKGWSVPFIRPRVGRPTEVGMAHYIAIIEDAGPDRAVGVWFPDLPGCTSAGDDIDEALRNAPEALYAEALQEDGRRLQRAGTLSELKADPATADDVRDNMVALIELRTRAHAAE